MCLESHLKTFSIPDDASAIEMQPPPQSLGITAFIQVTSETVLCPMSPCIHVVAPFFGDFLELNVTFRIFFLFLDFSPHVTTFILSYTFIMSVFSNFRTPFSHCKKKSDLDRQFFFIVWGIWGSISYLVYYFYMSPQSFFATISFIQHLAPKSFLLRRWCGVRLFR